MKYPDKIQLDLQIHSSKILLVFIITSHALALAGLWLSALDIPLTLFLSLATAIHCVYSYKKFYLQESPDAVVACSLRGDQWYLQLPGSDSVNEVCAELCGTFRLTSWFVSVRFRESGTGRCHDLALFSDSADADQLRRFRTWLGLVGASG